MVSHGLRTATLNAARAQSPKSFPQHELDRALANHCPCLVCALSIIFALFWLEMGAGIHLLMDLGDACPRWARLVADGKFWSCCRSGTPRVKIAVRRTRAASDTIPTAPADRQEN